jgi:hypothetical protein
VVDADSDDRFTLALVIQNIGSYTAYNVSLQANLSRHIYIPFDISSICVTFGSMELVVYTLDWESDPHSVSLNLQEVIPADGLPNARLVDGSNIVVVTFSILFLFVFEFCYVKIFIH